MGGVGLVVLSGVGVLVVWLVGAVRQGCPRSAEPGWAGLE